VHLVRGTAKYDVDRVDLLRTAYGRPNGDRYGDVAVMLARHTSPAGQRLELHTYR
jgi:hypothetical protein